MAEIGEGTYFAGNSRDGVDARQNITIGKYCQIADNVRFFDVRNHPCIRHPKYVANFPTDNLFGGEGSEVEGDFKIGNDVWIGENAVIMSNTEIADGAIIGAYAVVKGYVPPYAIVVGNPGKIVKFRFDADNEIINQLLKIQWWNWDKETIQKRAGDFTDIKKFIEKYGYKNELA